MSKNKANDAFTLIEVLIGVGIISIFGLGIVTLQSTLVQTQLSSLRNIYNIEEANTSITTLVREVRNIQTADSGAYPLEKADDQEMVFYSDIDFDGEAEKVSYRLEENSFIKGVIEPVGFPVTYPSANEKVRTISQNVRNSPTTPIFYYYNGDWPADTVNNPLPAPARLSETKLMRLYLELNSEEESTDNFILESYVQIRMLKENL
jgi:prepilin-type N-terminal cleavage/methylation domain-containing protein